MNNKLNVQSIFSSLDGEANGFGGAGELSTFIRLKGCNLRCSFCDTKYAQESLPENLMTIEEIINQIPIGCKKITLTGGSPFFQIEKAGLLIKTLLLHYEYQIAITIETNGSIDPADFAANYFKSMGVEGRETVRKTLILPYLDANSQYKIFYLDACPNVRLVVDYKLPSSGMEQHMNLNLFKKLRDIDIIKFVISDEKDYNRACEVIKEHPEWRAKKVFSPAISAIPSVIRYNPSTEEVKKIEEALKQQEGAILHLDFADLDIVRADTFNKDYMQWPRLLAEMMIRDGLYNIQFSLQIHKCLWPGTKVER